MLTLYTTPLSANGRKPLAVCRHLGLAPEITTVNVYTGEGRAPAYLAINPWGKVPTLVDGEFILWESNAILQYLAEAHGDFRLSSRDPQRRADIARWLFWESSAWQPAFVPVLTDFVGALLVGARPPSPDAVRWDDVRLQPLLQFVDAHLRGREFLVGNALSIADFSVGAMLMYVRPARFPFDRYANLAAWYARLEATDAWKATAAGPWAL